ncbi:MULTISPECIES: hypothetical protein [Haloferax]|uniref:hypothetical protein n=1 Tax=Haloferax TaxID=2251 RepID=UPI0003218E64|nr:hypothetical protein [Haloferax mediterranei]MDX5988068.1 hypothetical protein [Haloferax mediterranei ATCC 33500]
MLDDIIADLILDVVVRPLLKLLELTGSAVKRGVSKASAQFRRGVASAKSDETK